MMRIIVVGFLFALTFASLLCFGVIRPVRAQGTIHIRTDGSIDPPTAPISTVDNVTYTLSGNITSSGYGIVIERDNIVVDGSAYTLEGAGAYHGIHLNGRSNVTIRNIKIKGFIDGMWFMSCTSNSIQENTITDNMYAGIELDFSSNSNISRNIIIGNNDSGVRLFSSSDYNSVSGNIMTNNGDGVFLGGASYNIITSNNLVNNNYHGISINGGTSNTINGNNITNNKFNGIVLQSASNNNIRGNTIEHNDIGVELGWRSSSNTFWHNNFINNTVQVSLIPGDVNFFDNGSQGNYWSDYLIKHPYAIQIYSTGIMNTPYTIDENNTDHYPLIQPIPEFPSILILPLFFITTILGVIVYRKRMKRI